MKQPRILTIQDYSCLGRCSLTVAQPTISACGIECVALPTGVLSNHTMFPSWTFLDLTEEMGKIVEKWNDVPLRFSAIYTGYLATKQIPIVLSIIQKYRDEATFVFIDPAMGDAGKLYPGFGPEHVEEMKKLFAIADIVKPNLTEACLLLGEPFPSSPAQPLSYYEGLAKRIAALGPKRVLLSGVCQKEGMTGCLLYDGEQTKFFEDRLIPGSYHGTGDLYSSAFISAVVRGKSPFDASRIAHDYVKEAVSWNQKDQVNGLLYGPEFEKAIPSLIAALQ